MRDMQNCAITKENDIRCNSAVVRDLVELNESEIYVWRKMRGVRTPRVEDSPVRGYEGSRDG